MPGVTTSKSFKNKDGQWMGDGYRFEEDNTANQMAYLFAGKEGEKRAKEIREAAEKIDKPSDRRLFIETEIKKKASKVDETFQTGLTNLIQTLPKSGKDMHGQEAGKDFAVSLMQGLGLNVDPENVQTHYSPGPPQCFQVTWVNRPTENLKNSNSEINQLSQCYVNTLQPDEQQDFNKKWNTHVEYAKEGGPKIEPSAFELESAKLWSNFKGKVNQECGSSTNSQENLDYLNHRP